MAAAFLLKWPYSRQNPYVFGTTVSQVLVKCQWGLFIRNTCLYDFMETGTHTDREYSPEKAGVAGGPLVPAWSGGCSGHPGLGLPGHSPGKVLLVQGADSPEGGLHTGLAHERSRSCCPSALLSAGARGTPASASLCGPAGPWLVESARLDGE